MKKICAIVFILLFCKYQIVLSQNVGVGKTNPQEKLDVGGNINVDGTIKVKGVDGTAGQALMKNAAGTMVWGDLSQYENTIGFPSGSSPITNTVYTWTVPSGVTKLLVEAWGGGGGGAAGGGEGGGGYAAAEWVVTPGSTVNITVGAAGPGATSSSVEATNGNSSVVNINSVTLLAQGGYRATQSKGGSPGRFLNSSNLFAYGQSGAPGENNTETYGQYNSTTFYTAVKYGNGGQGGNTSLVNNNSGFKSFNNSTNATIKFVNCAIGTEPGGGGGGQSTGGERGGPGLVIIHY